MDSEAKETIKIKTVDGVVHIVHDTPSEVFPFISQPGILKYDGVLVGCLDGPAISFEDGLDIWFHNGEFVKLEAKPNVERNIVLSNGDSHWVRDGILHRDDMPALERADGTIAYYHEGFLHRLGGPAVIMADGTKEWFINGKRHRSDGPAIEFASGRKAWFVDGKRIKRKEFLKWQMANQSRVETECSTGSKSRVKLFAVPEEDAPDIAQTTQEAPQVDAERSEWTMPLLSLLAVGVASALKSTMSKEKKQQVKQIEVATIER